MRRAKLLAKEQEGQEKDKVHLNKLEKGEAKEEVKLEKDEDGLETRVAIVARRPKLKDN